MKIAAILLSVALFAGSRVLALEEHPVRGLVLKVDVENRSLVVSCDTIPGYMDAMEMPFAVQDPKTLAALKPGMTVRFTMVERANIFYAENIHAGTAANFEPEPVEAGVRLRGQRPRARQRIRWQREQRQEERVRSAARQRGCSEYP